MNRAESVVQTRMAVRNLVHAARFARTCRRIEKETANKDFVDARYDEIEANVVAGIFLSVASLEANLNEVLEDCPKFGCKLPDEAFRKVWEAWERKPTLEKFQFVLSLRGKDEMPKGEQVFQDTKALVDLRNVFVHFRPINDSETTGLTQQLKNKFKPNRFFIRETQLVPQGCMSYSCLAWAVRTSLSFTRDFLDRSGLASQFNSRDDTEFATWESE